MQITSIGIDLGKTTFHLIALDERGKIVIKQKFSRKQLLVYTANLASSLIGIEACSGAHFIGAALRDQGHEVRLIPAQFVKPFLKSNKNDFLDAEAIAEAVARQNMRFVPIKTDDQLDLQALHRVRDRLVHRRTALINQIRGFLLERGITFAKGPANLRNQMPAILEDAEQNLTPRLRSLLDHLWQEWKQLNSDVECVSDEIDAIASQDAACQRLRGIPGVGPLVATATVAAIGNGAAFRKGREFAAWLGLIPRQHSTGGKAHLLGISKRGNIYLRRLFVHGARAVLLCVKYDTGRLGQWMRQLELRAPRNKVIVAVANKLARIAWAVLSTGNEYRNTAVTAA
jgi:transposase